MQHTLPHTHDTYLYLLQHPDLVKSGRFGEGQEADTT
jgi:hypothetical protein